MKKSKQIKIDIESLQGKLSDIKNYVDTLIVKYGLDSEISIDSFVEYECAIMYEDDDNSRNYYSIIEAILKKK